MKVYQGHHPDKALYPNWILWLPRWMHHAVSRVQSMKATDSNLAVIRAFIDALEYEYLMKRRQLDEKGAKS